MGISVVFPETSAVSSVYAEFTSPKVRFYTSVMEQKLLKHWSSTQYTTNNDAYNYWFTFWNADIYVYVYDLYCINILHKVINIEFWKEKWI